MLTVNCLISLHLSIILNQSHSAINFETPDLFNDISVSMTGQGFLTPIIGHYEYKAKSKNECEKIASELGKEKINQFSSVPYKSDLIAKYFYYYDDNFFKHGKIEIRNEERND